MEYGFLWFMFGGVTGAIFSVFYTFNVMNKGLSEDVSRGHMTVQHRLYVITPATATATATASRITPLPTHRE